MFYRSIEVAGVAGYGLQSASGRGPSGPAKRRARRRRLRRARLVGAIAIAAFVAGLIVGANPSPSYSHTLAARFVAAWAHGNYATMYTTITPAARHELTARAFAAAYREALATVTATHQQVLGAPRDAPRQAAAVSIRGQSATVIVPVRVHTFLFGTLTEDFTLPIVGEGTGARIAWSRTLLFPGLRPGEELTRTTTLPRRAPLLARDGSVMPEGSGVTATLQSALDSRLRGTPGGDLYAGSRLLASAAPRAAVALRSTIDPAVQSAAVEALGSQYGGVVAMEPSTGAILAVAGIGIDAVQPPGSTFKMVTLTAALQAHVATPQTVFPYATYATLDGVKLSNANGEDCGGSLALAFAVSCNSVFAPLGVRVGAQRLVATAEHYGFNQPPGVPGAAESTLPPASQIQGELDVGSTAIGQGEVSASALEMATVAATIADGGLRPQPTFTLDDDGDDEGGAGSGSAAAAHPVAVARVRASTPAVAHTVRRLMIGVVREGTGTAAAIPGVTVAGKTGTAELGSPGGESCKSASESSSTASESGSSESSAGGCSAPSNDPQDTDAWFAAFAPALHPRIVVGVLMVRDGAGGATAAPVARQVLEAGLRAIH
jgi:peptidoglycan glycosyltransferase